MISKLVLLLVLDTQESFDQALEKLSSGNLVLTKLCVQGHDDLRFKVMEMTSSQLGYTRTRLF